MGIKRSTWQIEVAKEKHIKMLGDAWWHFIMLDYAG